MTGAAAQPGVYTPAHGRRFREVLGPHLLGIEGGFNDRKADRGGATKYGISLRFLKAEGRLDLDGDGFADFDLDFDGDIDGADIRLLTRAQALDLAERCFWVRHQLWRLPPPVDGMMLDQAFNGGYRAAARMLQRALNATFRQLLNLEPLKVDGSIGDVTLRRVALAAGDHWMGRLVDAYRAEAERRYRTIAKADPSQVENLNGWVNRARALGNV